MPQSHIEPSNDGTVEEPINREPDMTDLVASFITREGNYDRNHGVIQHKNAVEHVITVDGLVPKTLRLTVDDLENKFSQHHVTCALQCAGNRRHTMRTRVKEVSGVDWFDAAMMNCKWTGPLLRDVLFAAGVGQGKSVFNGKPQKHVQFANYGSEVQEDKWYGGSIPFTRAMDETMDVILALKMNDEPLPARHGFPVRTIVPGVLGARSVKWLDRITVSDEESSNFYQKHDYKVLPPDATDAKTAEKYWNTTPAMLEMPVNACVASPVSNSTVHLSADGLLEVRGYAVPRGHDGPVVRVEVSGDEGKTWIDAEIDNGGEAGSRWSWVLWHTHIKMEKGNGRKIFARATDNSGNVQLEEKSTWNLRGVAYNGYEATYDLTVT